MSQFERIAHIDRLLREQGSVRTDEVAERFEVSARQVKRDIEHLRDRLVNYAGRWYLVAWDLPREALRTFHPSRVERLSISKERNTSPSPPGRDVASLDAFLAAGFGIFKGASATEATIRIRGTAAAIVARQSWHPKQRVERGVGSDGEPYTDMTVPVAEWTELLGRVLSFGSAAEALAPQEFRKAWKEEIRKMGERARI